VLQREKEMLTVELRYGIFVMHHSGVDTLTSLKEMKMQKRFMLQAEAGAQVSAGSSKASRFCDKDYDIDSGVATFKFGNGTTLEQNVDELPQAVQRQLMLHGFMQKVGDSYASAKGNYSEGIENAQDVIGNLKAGEWGSTREGEGKPRLGELSAAIARVKAITLEVATTAVEAAPEEKRKIWRAHPKIKAAIAAIRAEKAQKELEAAAASGDVEL
jgi:hypothetical protein